MELEKEPNSPVGDVVTSGKPANHEALQNAEAGFRLSGPPINPHEATLPKWRLISLLIWYVNLVLSRKKSTN